MALLMQRTCIACGRSYKGLVPDIQIGENAIALCEDCLEFHEWLDALWEDAGPHRLAVDRAITADDTHVAVRWGQIRKRRVKKYPVLDRLLAAILREERECVLEYSIDDGPWTRLTPPEQL